ncbi:MAG: hypothetical protein L6R40_007811 [Gallowayella cf. fulva]|nr:MAG: hypothetical protein L6R40_007811 [Xanthomendoza cf. fulva]
MTNLATIEMASYYPLDTSNYRNPDTWTLYITDPSGSTSSSLHRLVHEPDYTNIRQVSVEARYDCHPRTFRKYKERHLVGYVQNGMLAKVRNEIQGVQLSCVSNAASQTWVMDVLDVLQKKGLIGIDWQWPRWADYHRTG